MPAVLVGVGEITIRETALTSIESSSIRNTVEANDYPMSCYIIDRMGGGEDGDDDPSVQRMLHHMNSFDPDYQEHACVTLAHRESGWSIAVFESGLLILEQSDSDVPPRHMRITDQQKILSLWQTLAAGNIDAVMAEPWAPGYGS